MTVPSPPRRNKRQALGRLPRQKIVSDQGGCTISAQYSIPGGWRQPARTAWPDPVDGLWGGAR